MNHTSVLHKRATLRKISIKVFINQHHHKPNAWCSGSAQQSYLRDPGSKPRCGLFFSPNSNTVYMSIKLIIPVKTTKNPQKMPSQVIYDELITYVMIRHCSVTKN